MRCATKFCYRLDKTASETVKLMKEAYNEKYFDESLVFKWHGDFKKMMFVRRTDAKACRTRKCFE